MKQWRTEEIPMSMDRDWLRLNREKLMEYEESTAEILCMLERFFPPAFFDILIHLVIHIGREVRLCGPVQFRWIYPFERYMKVLKGYVRNRAKPEGCIAEGYLADECISFVSEFIEGARELDNNRMRNEEFCNDLILEGRPISSGKPIKLTNEMTESAHRYVLFNMAIVEPFLEMHMEYLRRTNKSLRKNPSLLWKTYAETFPSWLKQKICIDSVVNGSETLRFLAHGPKTYAMSYNGYIIKKRPSRVAVWTKAHTNKTGEPVSMAVGEAIVLIYAFCFIILTLYYVVILGNECTDVCVLEAFNQINY